MKPIDEDFKKLTNRTKTDRLSVLHYFLTDRGFRIIYFYRKSRHHFLNNHRTRLLIWRAVNHMTIKDVDMAYLTDIQGGLKFVHPFAIAIGGGRIGRNCTIYQCVTIGANYKIDENGRQYPIIGDNVRISPGAVVLGPITIGSNVVIGANSVVIRDIPDNCVVAGAPAKVIGKYDKNKFRQ